MTDALVKELNRRGYQTMFLPRTGVTPPDLYTYVPTQGKLVRRTNLSKYLPPDTKLALASGRVADIEHHTTSSKNQKLAGNFLRNALACIGIDGAPKVELSFTGQTDLVFRFTGVSYLVFEEMDFVIDSMKMDALPPEYVDEDLHVAYEYLYASQLLVSREDQRSFEHDVSASVSQFIDIGTKGKVEVQSGTTISFSGNAVDRAAFAFKVGQLVRNDEKKKWYFYPEESKLSGDDGARRPLLLAPGVVLRAEGGD